MKFNVDDEEMGEHAIRIDWFEGLTVSKQNAKSVKGLNLGITQHIYTDLTENKRKRDFIASEFDVNFEFK